MKALGLMKSFRCQFESGFDYRLSVLAAIFPLFQRG